VQQQVITAAVADQAAVAVAVIPKALAELDHKAATAVPAVDPQYFVAVAVAVILPTAAVQDRLIMAVTEQHHLLQEHP